MLIIIDGRILVRRKYTVNVTRKPKEMTFEHRDRDGKIKTASAIYKIEQGKLTICASLQGAEIPHSFEAPPGSHRSLDTHFKLSGNTVGPGAILPTTGMAKEDLRLELDYSIASIQKVDEIMGRYHMILSRGEKIPSADAITTRFGLYLVAVIEKHYGPGHLDLEDRDNDPSLIRFVWRNQIMRPSDWCQKRINEGDPASIWLRFRSYFPEDPAGK